MLYVSSILRNSTSYIDTYMAQLDALADHILPTPLHVIVAEGDSTDDTAFTLRQALNTSAYETTLLTVNHGGPMFPSIDHPARWNQIAQVCNRVMTRVSDEIQPDDHFIYVESDLIWSPATFLTLLDGLTAFPAVAAMSYHPGSHYFYDTWGHVGRDGALFTREPPYHSSLQGSRYVEISSAGSCFALRGSVVPTTRFSPVDCIRGIGRTLRQQGHSLHLDTESEVIHP